MILFIRQYYMHSCITHNGVDIRWTSCQWCAISALLYTRRHRNGIFYWCCVSGMLGKKMKPNTSDLKSNWGGKVVLYYVAVTCCIFVRYFSLFATLKCSKTVKDNLIFSIRKVRLVLGFYCFSHNLFEFKIREWSYSFQ